MHSKADGVGQQGRAREQGQALPASALRAASTRYPQRDWRLEQHRPAAATPPVLQGTSQETPRQQRPQTLSHRRDAVLTLKPVTHAAPMAAPSVRAKRSTPQHRPNPMSDRVRRGTGLHKSSTWHNSSIHLSDLSCLVHLPLRHAGAGSGVAAPTGRLKQVERLQPT